MEQPVDFTCDRLLDNTKSYETAMAEYHLDKESGQPPLRLPNTEAEAIYRHWQTWP